MSAASRPLAAVLGVGVVALLAGCAPTVGMDAAPRADSPRCAGVVARLPDAVAGEARRTTDAQATGAWGSPASVLLRCGLAPIGPTTRPCVAAAGIDWVLETPPGASPARYLTFGRSPATEVVVDERRAADYRVLGDLADALASIPATRSCR